MSSIVTFWYRRIVAADPIGAAVALDIARQSAANPSFDTEAAITAKLNEWKISPDSPQARGFRFAVIYSQEDIAVRTAQEGAAQCLK